MRRRLRRFLRERRERIGDRLRYGPRKCYVRCPACKRIQPVPVGQGQMKVVCRRCGEIFLRRT